MKTTNNELVLSYLQTASWVTCDSGECTDFTRQAKISAKADCEKFFALVSDKLGQDKATEIFNIKGSDLGCLAGHDFFLTRNHHGAGFWDKENIYGENEAKILTDISHKMGTIDCYHVRGPKSKLTF